MNMNQLRPILLFFIGLVSIALPSCTKEESSPRAPAIQLLQLGSAQFVDDRTLYTGQEAHFEAKIIAPAAVRKIELEIRQKSGYGNYSFTKEYTTPYSGQTAIADFHDYPLLPEDLALGDYSFQLKVTDTQGQIGKVESDVTMKAGDGSGGGGHVHVP